MGLLSSIGSIFKAVSPVAPFLSAGLSFLGGERRNTAQIQQANIAGAFNRASAREQMDFQKEMSDTAVQRRMADLRAGGINPILAGQYDASTPAGAMAQRPMPLIEDPVTAGIQTGLQAGKVGADIGVAQESMYKIAADTNLSLKTVEKLSREIDLLVEEIANAIRQGAILDVEPELKQRLTALAEANEQHVSAMWKIVEQEAKVREQRPDLVESELAAKGAAGFFGVGGQVNSALSYLKAWLEDLFNE